jgi:hypothetical protein
MTKQSVISGPTQSSERKSSSVSRNKRQVSTCGFSGLQQTLGNQAILQLFEAGTIQAKLRVSQPGDSDEVDADRVAEKVVAKSRAPVIQRKCACDGRPSCSKCAAAQQEDTIHRSVATPKSRSLQPTIQRAPADPTSTSDPVPAAPETQPPGAKKSGTLVVEDNATKVEPYQMRKSQFITLLRTDACAAADRALASVKHTTEGCPYVSKWLSFYEKQSSEHIERAIHKYAPEATTARSAHEAIRIIVMRVERAAIKWAKTGKVERMPKELANELPGQGGFLGAVQRVASSKVGGAILGFIGGTKKQENSDLDQIQRKAQNATATPAHDAAGVKKQLGSGHSLNSRVQSQMSSAFGYDFSGVRVHTDSSAAKLSSDLRARAFTVGNDVAFASGEYRPGTLIGDALIAHELAHVVQQGGTNQSNTLMRKGDGDYNALEADADTSAVRAAVSLWGGLKTGIGRNVLPALRSGLRLQGCKSKAPTTGIADQRAAIAPGGPATLPTADLATQLGYELDPSSRPAPPPPVPVGAPPPPPPPRIPWDGRTGAPGFAAARTVMQAELFKAFDAYLTFFRATTVATLAQPRVPFTPPAAAPAGAGAGAGAAIAPPATGVVNIANQAREVLETRYHTSMDAAASSPQQLSDRTVRQPTGPGQNIFDPYNAADRSTVTATPDLAPGVAWWLFENDAPGAAGAPGSRQFATQILAAHHYSVADAGAEQFRWDVANAYAAAATLAPNNRQQLIDYRLTGWNERGEKGITLLSSFTPGPNPNRAELQQRWEIFRTATHESLHLRAHPAFTAAEQGRNTMAEGFVEMFTVATLNTDVLPRTRAGSAEPLRRTIEGALSPAAPDATLITNRVTPTQYVEPRAEAERIRDGGTPPGGTPHAGVGEAAVRAAFFQGHVEYLGLAPGGAQIATLPATAAPVKIRVPGGITGLDDLARRTGVPRTTIQASNPGITDALPPTAVLTGCREHWVVTGETRANVAAQNGVSEADLVRANPDVTAAAWGALTAGQKILIPVH